MAVYDLLAIKRNLKCLSGIYVAALRFCVYISLYYVIHDILFCELYSYLNND